MNSNRVMVLLLGMIQIFVHSDTLEELRQTVGKQIPTLHDNIFRIRAVSP